MKEPDQADWENLLHSPKAVENIINHHANNQSSEWKIDLYVKSTTDCTILSILGRPANGIHQCQYGST